MIIPAVKNHPARAAQRPDVPARFADNQATPKSARVCHIWYWTAVEKISRNPESPSSPMIADCAAAHSQDPADPGDDDPETPVFRDHGLTGSVRRMDCRTASSNGPAAMPSADCSASRKEAMSFSRIPMVFSGS